MYKLFIGLFFGFVVVKTSFAQVVSFSEPFMTWSSSEYYISPPVVSEISKKVWPNYIPYANGEECRSREKLINLRLNKLAKQMKVNMSADKQNYTYTRIGTIVTTHYNNKRPETRTSYASYCQMDLYLPKQLKFEVYEELFEGPTALSDCNMQLSLDYYLYGLDQDGNLRKPHYQTATLSSVCVSLGQGAYAAQEVLLKVD